jgi:hypothetical protein
MQCLIMQLKTDSRGLRRRILHLNRPPSWQPEAYAFWPF